MGSRLDELVQGHRRVRWLAAAHRLRAGLGGRSGRYQ